MSILNNLLSDADRTLVLDQLFNFTLIINEVEEVVTYTILDDAGNEFNPEIDGNFYYLDTLQSVIDYSNYRAKNQGKTQNQNDIKTALGIL